MDSEANKSNIKQLQHYNLFKDKILGKGTFGIVFEGEDRKHGNKPVAIKAIPLEKFKQHPEKILPQLKNEIKNMQMLHHRHVVQLFNVIKTDNHLYMVVEYCNGGSLENEIRSKNRNEAQHASYMCQIIEGFKCLRGNNIVHRDLKPENLLLHDKMVKIADFGFSRVVETGMDEPTLISFVGTPFYMSPQVLQKQNYSSKTDIWSLGMIYYELLYGRRAWEGKGYFILLENVLTKPLLFPQQPRVKPQVKAIIARMLALKEEDRISWEELFTFFSASSLRALYADHNSSSNNNNLNVAVNNNNNKSNNNNNEDLPGQQLLKQPSSPDSLSSLSKVTMEEESDRVTIISAFSNSNQIEEEFGSINAHQNGLQQQQEEIQPGISNQTNSRNTFEQQSKQNSMFMPSFANPVLPNYKDKTTNNITSTVTPPPLVAPSPFPIPSSLPLTSQQQQPTQQFKLLPPSDDLLSEQQMKGLLSYFNQKLNYAQHLQLVNYMQQLLNKRKGQKLTFKDVNDIMSQQFAQIPGRVMPNIPLIPFLARPIIPLKKQNTNEKQEEEQQQQEVSKNKDNQEQQPEQQKIQQGQEQIIGLTNQMQNTVEQKVGDQKDQESYQQQVEWQSENQTISGKKEQDQITLQQSILPFQQDLEGQENEQGSEQQQQQQFMPQENNLQQMEVPIWNRTLQTSVQNSNQQYEQQQLGQSNQDQVPSFLNNSNNLGQSFQGLKADPWLMNSYGS